MQKRKAQNRAAQRAFRERKEKHLKDLETKVEELEKASETANHENHLLKAQVERLQVELREYRKRLSWVSGGNGLSTMSAFHNNHNNPTRNLSGLSNSEFFFDFPKFGDLPGSHIFKNDSKDNQNKSSSPSTSAVSPSNGVTGTQSRGSPNGNNQSSQKPKNANGSFNAYARDSTAYKKTSSNSSSASNTDSPSASSDSQHGPTSSIGTSPEPSLNSPNVSKANEAGCDHIDGEKSFCEQLGMACGNIKNPVPAVRSKTSDNPQSLGQLRPTAADESLSFDWLVQQNGGGSFDPLLFQAYREPQDAVLSQDFGAFFNDAFPLPDLGSPFGNMNNDVSTPNAASANAPKTDLIAQIDKKQDDEDEVVPGEDKSQMMTCTGIWLVLPHLMVIIKFTANWISAGIDCNPWRNFAMVRLTSIRCVRNSAPRHPAPREG
jgi:AP-1-like factor